MSTYEPIHCNLHDHIEAACLFRYRLRIVTEDGRILPGTAKTTETDTKKQEWLLLDQDQDCLKIRMDNIRVLDVLTPGARFSRVDFREHGTTGSA